MYFFRTVTATLACCVFGLHGTLCAEEQLGLRGQLYFDPAPAMVPPQGSIPRHIQTKHVARAPIDFSYPETAASTGTHVAPRGVQQPQGQSAWQFDLSDGAKLRFAYDKDTKIKVGMGMWKVNVGVSKPFGGPSTGTSWTLPVRHGRAASLGRAGTSEQGHPLD